MKWRIEDWWDFPRADSGGLEWITITCLVFGERRVGTLRTWTYS